MQNVILPSPFYKNCKIRGLPVTAPFRIYYDVCDKGRQVGTFIILPYQTVPGTQLFDFTEPCIVESFKERFIEEETELINETDDNFNTSSNYIECVFEKKFNDDDIKSINETDINSFAAPNHLKDQNDEIGIKTEPEEVDNNENDNNDTTYQLDKELKQEEYEQEVNLDAPVLLNKTIKQGDESGIKTKEGGQSPLKECLFKGNILDHAYALTNKKKRPQNTIVKNEEIQTSSLESKETVNEEFYVSRSKNKRKLAAEINLKLEEMQKPKLLKLDQSDDEEIGGSRRKSKRLRCTGFRPDYSNVENKIDAVFDYLEVDTESSDIGNNEQQEQNVKDENNETENQNDYIDSKALSDKRNKVEQKPKKDEDPDYNPDEFSAKSWHKSEDNECDNEDDNESNNLTDSSESDEYCSDSDSESIDWSSPRKYFRKKSSKKKSQKKRIIVSLKDHQDKYRLDTLDSIARKDRGKSDVERVVSVYSCIMCNNFTSESIEGIESHLEHHLNGELNCKECDFGGSSIGELSLHRSQMHKKHARICPECGIQVGYKQLKTHFGVAHNNPQYECIYCQGNEGEVIKFPTRNQRRKHLKECHRDVCTTCINCDKVFLKEKDLTIHKRSCNGRKELEVCKQCEKCGKKFKNDNSLYLHTQRIHLKVRKYLCNECPFAAKSPSVLKNHKMVHQGVHPFKCDQCSFTCVQAYQLTSHMRTHTGEKPYKCTQCKYAAAWNVQLKEHVKVHVMGTAVMCQNCNVVFKNEKTLNIHIKKHKCVL